MADFNWDDAKSGAFTGAGAGAMVGTAVMPGLGTVAGGAIGAIGGGLIGGFGGFGGGLWDTMSGQIDPNARFGDANAARKDQLANEGTLQQWSAGNGPSAAQSLLDRNRAVGQDRAISNAKAGAGGNTALQATLANRQQAQVAADAGFQGAQIRSQEQQQAMQQYQNALNMRRQQDIAIAQAKMEQDQKNAEKNSGFIGDVMSGIGGGIGGLL